MKFNSRFAPIHVEPVKTHVETLSGSYLDYDEKGKVVVYTGQPVNLFEITQSYADESSLECQLSRLRALGVDTELKEENCFDSRLLPKDIEQVIEMKKNNEALKAQVESMGIKLDDALKGDINKIVEDYVNRKLKDVKVISSDANKEDKQ